MDSDFLRFSVLGFRICALGRLARRREEDEVQAARASGGQWIPEAGEAEAGEVGFVACGEFGHTVVP